MNGRGRRKLSPHATKFGEQVKALRLAGALTQAELAESSGISERTVSDLERGLRAAVYPATARQLARALHVRQDDLATFLAAARGQGEQGASAPSQLASDSPPWSRLPVPLTRLVGREVDLAIVLSLVRAPETRLVTLIGPGGVGKTRLAAEVATITQDEFAGGTFFVNLSAIDEPGMVLPAIGSAVGLLPGRGELAPLMSRRLGEELALVVLDTFEHIVAAAPAIAELAAACPSLTVLTTSRTGLHVRGEREVPLHPLAVRTAGLPEAAPAPAVELFIERLAAVAPGLPVTSATTDVVTDICARLDGLPLAIELAAARVKHMSLSDLLMHLDHRLDPLVGGARDLPSRHQTMRGALDWSYELLGAAEMRLFRCLSVFRGGFGREAAEAMVGSNSAARSPDVLSTLSALVDSSLVLVEAGTSGQARYRLLDVIREYAVERAVTAGEREPLRQRHAEYFLAIAERAEPELRGSDQQDWYARLLEDEGNFRAALTWAPEVGEAEVALRLAGALWMFWRWAGLFAEGRAWLGAALAAGEACPQEVRCQGLWGAGWLAYHHGDYEQTDEAGRRLLSVGNDGLERRNALTLIGNAALAEGRGEDAVTALGEALAVCERLGISWHLGTSLLNLGIALLYSSRAPEGRALLERARATYEELGDRHFTARTLRQLGYASLVMGQPAAAAAQIRRGMEMAADLGDDWSIAEGLEAVATMCSESAPRTAALLAGAAERLRERISMRPHPSDASINRAYLDLARERLPAGAFDDAWREGQGMALESGVGLALEACLSFS